MGDSTQSSLFSQSSIVLESIPDSNSSSNLIESEDNNSPCNTDTKSLAHILKVEPYIKLEIPEKSAFKQPLVIGHRGAPYKEPENTLSSFSRAIELGCDGVELDVFLLKCGTLAVFHGDGSDEHPGGL